MISNINIFSDTNIKQFLNNLIFSKKLNFKDIKDLTAENLNQEGGIIFFDNKKMQDLSFLKNISSEYLIILPPNTNIDLTNKNLTIIEAPISINKFKNILTKFLFNKKYKTEDIEIIDKNIINSKNKMKSSLTDIENEILIYLITNQNCSKNFIKENILKVKVSVETNSLESHLTRIRKKLEDISSNLKLKSKADKLELFTN